MSLGGPDARTAASLKCSGEGQRVLSPQRVGPPRTSRESRTSHARDAQTSSPRRLAGPWPGPRLAGLSGALLSPSDRTPSSRALRYRTLLKLQPRSTPSVRPGAQSRAPGLDGRPEAARASRGLASEVGPAFSLRRSVMEGGGRRSGV